MTALTAKAKVTLGWGSFVNPDCSAQDVADFVVAQVPLSFQFLGGTPPLASEIMGLEVFSKRVVFAANFAGAYGTCLVNPTATFTITIAKNGTAVGTITVSTAGVWAFATSTNAPVTFNPGDVMSFPAQLGPDATFANGAWTLQPVVL